ncbi:MAG TPA: 2,3-diaminopropionate biosynthesis protein SbnB [Pyrinomonadaceae bacterium]
MANKIEKARGIAIFSGEETLSVLAGRELEIVEVVQRAYEAHSRGKSSLPHSTFLRFPEAEQNRIIALPAFLGDTFQVAGMKWISSFPNNPSANGIERASAVVVLNSMETGRPQALIEGSVISARRTAASAALGARWLHDGPTAHVGIIGCGLINFEITRFLLATLKGIESILVFDKDVEKARQFKNSCRTLSTQLEVDIAPDVENVFADCSLIALATTAGTPHIQQLPPSQAPRTILHISLRDFSPEIIIGSDNVVDDVDHVCRANTSLHLAELATGKRDFIRCSLGDVLLGHAEPRNKNHETTIFSPFGLGILDIALADFVFQQGIAKGMGTMIESFFPLAWTERAEQPLEKHASG